jgi:hypothetical protein
MTLVVEDGTGLNPAANTYISNADFVTYAAARGYTAVGNVDQLIISAMDYIEGLPFQGIKQLLLQPLQFPRYRLYIDGYPLLSNKIPIQLKDGLCQVVIAIDQGNSPLQDQPRTVLKEKVNGIEIDYSASSAAVVINVSVRNSLYKLLTAGGGFNGLVVGKA